MANTYTQIHIHTIFAVKTRAGLIREQWRDDLYKYIVGIIQRNQHKVLCINGMPDHIHILFGMRPVQSLSDLMQDVKGSSSKWINDQRFIVGHFEWQSGYGGFSYSKSQIPQIISYIRNQEEHHRQKTFVEEYGNSSLYLALNMTNDTFLNPSNSVNLLAQNNIRHHIHHKINIALGIIHLIKLFTKMR